MKDLLHFASKLPIAFGGASVSGEGGGYGFGEMSEDSSINFLKYAYDRGLRIFDTAPIYGFSLSEQRIGKAFKNIREKVFIVSKSGVTWHDSKRVNMTNDPVITRLMLEQSLKDLKSEYIDLYMIHWPDKNVDIRFTMEVLAKAKNEGKIKHIGLCNTNKDEFYKAIEIDKVEVLQSELNLFNRTAEKELFPLVVDNDLGFMSWGTFDKGILTGRVNIDRTFDKSDCRSWAPWWKKSNLGFKFQKYKELVPLLEEHKIDGVALSLAHSLSFKETSVAICGMRSEEQLDSVINALEKLPNQEIIDEAVEICCE